MHDDYMDFYTEIDFTAILTKNEDSPSNAASSSCWCHQFTLYNESETHCLCQSEELKDCFSVAPSSFDEYIKAITVTENLKSQDHYFQDLMTDMEFIFTEAVG